MIKIEVILFTCENSDS